VYAFVLIALVSLLLGFFLLLFGANPDAPFTDWVYRGLARVTPGSGRWVGSTRDLLSGPPAS
jgi:hypothetical protein